MAGFPANDGLAAAGGNVHDRGCQPLPLRIGDDERDAGLDRRHQRVGRAEIDADDSAHALLRQETARLARILAVGFV